MILPTENLPHDSSTEFDIAIVGAGAVGVAIARRLADHRFGRIVLVEAGGARFDAEKQRRFFAAAEVSDHRHPPGDLPAQNVGRHDVDLGRPLHPDATRGFRADRGPNRMADRL